jgi:hypothetical protein
VQLVGKEAHRNQVDELGEEAAEGDEGGERVPSAGLERLGGQADLERKVVGLVEDAIGEALQVGLGERLAVAAMFEGVEVARGGTDAAGAEFVVAMGTAAGLSAHGPGTAARDLAGRFVWVSGHGGAPGELRIRNGEL